MNGYLLTMIGMILISSILTALTADGKTSSIIKNMTKIACIVVIISPILTFFQKGEIVWEQSENNNDFFSQSVIESENTFIKYYSELRIEQTEKALEKELFEKFSKNVSVKLDWERQKESFQEKYTVDGIRILKIHIISKEKLDEEVKNEMSAYVTKNYCSEVKIE